MNNTTKNAIKKINALPKSFDKTKTNTWIADIIVVMNTVLKLVFLHNIAARKKTNIIFTNSDGWKVIPFIEKEIFDPYVISPNIKTVLKKEIPINAYNQ